MMIGLQDVVLAAFIGWKGAEEGMLDSSMVVIVNKFGDLLRGWVDFMAYQPL